MLPIMILADRPWTLPMPGAGSWAALLGLSLFSTALAYILFFRILARAGATAVSLVTLLVPVGAVLLGTAFLEERVGASGWAGMALVGLGLLVLDGRAFRAIAGRTG
jgi:drug/metabolite transporter (DMT)-like permease